MTSSPNPGAGQTQPLGFGQPLFGQPSATSVSTNTFGAVQSVTQSRGFDASGFTFKPSNEALFKPIFSASPEPANPQNTAMSGSPFGSSASQTSAGTLPTDTTSLLTGAKSGPVGFSFSQPAATPAVSAKSNPLTTGIKTGPSSSMQFTFSQPAAPSGSSPQAVASASQPTTPSSFSFSVKPSQGPQAAAAAALFSQQPSSSALFGDSKYSAVKVDAVPEDEGGGGSLAETNVFARLSKGTKRKEDPLVAGPPANPDAEESPAAETDSARHQPKRALLRSRGPAAGLFGRALSDLRRDTTTTTAGAATAMPPPPKYPLAKETEPHGSIWEEPGEVQVQVQVQGAGPPASVASAPTQSRDVLVKTEFAEDIGKDLDVTPGATTPVKRSVRRESSESLSGVSPTDSLVLHCRNVPAALNKKEILEKHFSRFGKVHRVFCRPAKNSAIVNFHDHASAARAKKKGKNLHRHELLLLWQRKKQSPAGKEVRPAAGGEEKREDSHEMAESMSTGSPLKRLSAKPPAVGGILTSSSPVKKSLSAKSLQFDSEPLKESSSAAPGFEATVPSSLLHLVGLLAETAEDKYRLLEQRDKVLRQGQPKRTDLDMSKVFVGTCPDMCPEKERFMRETRKQLSVFEVIRDTEMVDHAAAIKEYSRSSADQEEPLPHDLRPLPVLCMTMDYLVTRIMDQNSEAYRDWYDFVWNRTRGIRKDITQQRLCCPSTVSLIEKCTRFHIHCAHHLCEESMSSFDAKINNENMTKCLQSLKEMYQDLATRQTYCAQEAEFRQYSVLVKLNDGDILREVQQFRDEVRNSPEVKFAVQAFTAVNNNNFVRFFKLVKGASYLAGCLLHRYFNQVRAKALKTLNQAHTISHHRSTTFPLEDIERILMFRDAAEATDFIQQYGLAVSEDLVELSRMTYQEPDLPVSHSKSEVILAKRYVLIGEVVNGGPLPSPLQHGPVCSFDAQNKYRGEGPLAEPAVAQFRVFPPAAKLDFKAPPSGDIPAQPFQMPAAIKEKVGEPGEPGRSSAPPAVDQPQIPQLQPVNPPSPPPRPQLVYSHEDVAAVLEGAIAEVVDSGVRDVAHTCASYVSTALVESSSQTESLLDEVLGEMLSELCSAEVELERERLARERRLLEEARRKQEHEAFLQHFSASLCTEIIHEVLDETIQETSAAEIQLAVHEKADCVAKCTQHVCSTLVEETLSAEMTLLVKSVLEAELQRIHKYISRWRDVVAVRRQLKRQMRGFPAAPCCVDPQFKLRALAPSAPAHPSMEGLARGLTNLGNAGTLSLSSTRTLKMRREVVHQMRVHYYFQQLLDNRVWAPLDLPSLVAENIANRQRRVFWKAVLLLPSDHDNVASVADRILSDWLEVKFGSDSVSDSAEGQLDGTLRTLCVSDTLLEKDECRVYVSIKSSRGPLSSDGLAKMEERCELHGTEALVALLPALAGLEPDEQDVHLLSALLQLKQLQQASSWHCPLPLVMLVPGPEDGDTHKLEEALTLHKLVSEGLISEYKFVFIPETTSDLQGSTQLGLAVRWLLARVPPALGLSCQTLAQLVEASLSREFTARVFAHQQERAAARLPPAELAPVVQLYNAVVAHVAEKTTSPELVGLSWPPCEFWRPETSCSVPHLGWNSAQHLAWLRRAILSLQLPPWTQPSGSDSWSELCLSVARYAAMVPASHRSQPLLMSRLENLLEKVRRKGHRVGGGGSGADTARWSHEDDDLYPAACSIPWDDVLIICIDHKLRDWQMPGPPVCEDAVTEDGEILVYFLDDSLKGFQPPDEWMEAIRQTHKEKQLEAAGASEAAGAMFSSFCPRQNLFHTEMEPVEAAPGPLDITHTPTAQELLAHRVLRGLQEEKSESRRSLEQFQRWLDGDPVSHLTTPLFIPSSTLLSAPTTLRHGPAPKTPPTQELEVDEQSEAAGWSSARPASLAWRLQELERQIVASHEEELACRLKLSGLLSIVDD